MNVLANVCLDLIIPKFITIHAVQDDKLTRTVHARLLAGGLPWQVPSGALALVRFMKPDRTSGFYDTLEDGSPAVTVETGRTSINFTLAQQALAVPGDVFVQVNFYTSAGAALSSFSLRVDVHRSVCSDESIISGDYYNALTATLADMASEVEAFRAAMQAGYGAPRIAATAADMTNVGCVYVYTGTTGGGLTYGHWYTWSGSAWTDGGIYQSAGINTDTTLTNPDMAANAKATGDAIQAVEATVKGLTPVNICEGATLSSGIINVSTGATQTSTSGLHTGYIDVSSFSKIRYTRVCSVNSTVTWGMTFYDVSKTHIAGSGQRAKTSAAAISYELADIDVPEGAVYARFTWISSLGAGDFAVYDYDQYMGAAVQTLSDRLDAAEGEIEDIENIIATPTPIDTGAVTSSAINYKTGATLASTSLGHTDYIDLTGISKIVYTRITATGSSSNAGIAFYSAQSVDSYISGQRAKLNQPAFGYELTELLVPAGAVYARFSVSLNLTGFLLYDYADYSKSLIIRVDNLEKGIQPRYEGKIVSILGDSISTFAAATEKEDGRAAAGCTTNYPGNVVKYEASTVTNVGLTWWGRVIDQMGMELGINESWAGSCIAYNPEQTSSGKYTADNCLCSATRIGHLGENGTPDLIMIFGGTNDINHHRVSNGSTLRYPVGELNSTNNPYDFDNFPMITETYYGSITTMLLRIQHGYPNATILMLLPFFCTYSHTSSGDRATPYDQDVWSRAAIDVCQYLGVEYLDLRKIINMYDVQTLLFDDLHPNATGMEAIARAVMHKLDTML